MIPLLLFVLIGDVYADIDAGRWLEADRRLANIEASSPAHGYRWLRSGDYNAAAAAFEAALADADADAEPERAASLRLFLAESHLFGGNPAAVLKVLDVGEEGAVERRLRLEALVALGRCQEAASLSDLSADGVPGARRAVLGCLIRAEHVAAALVYAQAEPDAFSGEEHRLTRLKLAQRGRWAPLFEWVEQNPRDAEAERLLTWSLRHAGLAYRAIAQGRHSVAAGGRKSQHTTLLAAIARDLDRLELASRLSIQGLPARGARLERFRVLMQQGDYERALVQLEGLPANALSPEVLRARDYARGAGGRTLQADRP